ncbi:hypothetical protein TWF569_000544 [Orbilia oligospora]|uniref:BTB domain-containing protein n=1 Tax=Orbilia oligospora TaxID=2813651 RepID=A0A7C8JNC3_ORBOL|nr:hypothetical protein TWF102_004272 [Orbilia oligospora]KAF3117806.1 hypothetical protein TWF103_004480 [Orbilia oligospora]KAF3126468.1 hypothetical protein TWF569_000544 [Orbilia oligospora]KAF3142115.1 hypothetical protein TWF703_001338 [Orbilia oligospora]
MVRGHTENLVHSCEILEIDVNARNEIERLPRHCASGILVVFVGENKRKYRVHLDAFRGASPFFERETLQKSKDSHIQNITLTEKVDDPEAFEMFIQFAYIKNYIVPNKRALDQLFIHAKVYVLAERLECTDLKALAVKRATRYCLGSFNTASRYNGVIASLPRAISTIYSFTVDPNSGRPPGRKGGETEGSLVEYIIRDPFRLLLAKISSCHLAELKTKQDFLRIHSTRSDFATDLLLFLGSGEKMQVDKNGNMVYPFQFV